MRHPVVINAGGTVIKRHILRLPPSLGKTTIIHVLMEYFDQKQPQGMILL